MKIDKNELKRKADLKAQNNNKNQKTLFLLASVSIIIAGLYFFILYTTDLMKYTELIMIIYLSLLAISAFAYVFYNKGFTQKNMTMDMLPTEWTKEAKEAFLNESKTRAKKSKWMLFIIFPLTVTFAIDCMLLFVVPFFANLFN